MALPLRSFKLWNSASTLVAGMDASWGNSAIAQGSAPMIMTVITAVEEHARPECHASQRGKRAWRTQRRDVSARTKLYRDLQLRPRSDERDAQEGWDDVRRQHQN